MTLIIDGHNLIGAGVFDDIRLSDEDDEAKLVARLRVWRSRVRTKMLVFFDRGITGGRDRRMGGAGVEVIFAADPAEADDLIRRRLRQAARGTILVSNDDALAQEAIRRGLQVWRGAEFVDRMTLRGPVPATVEAGEEEDVSLTPEEVDEWLAVFRARAKARKRRADAKRAAQQAGQSSGAPSAKKRRPDGRTPSRKSGGKAPDSKTSDFKTSDGKTVDGKPQDDKAPRAKKPRAKKPKLPKTNRDK